MTINVNSEGHLEMKADLTTEGAVADARNKVEDALAMLGNVPENGWINVDAVGLAEELLAQATAQLAAVRRRALARMRDAAAVKVQP